MEKRVIKKVTRANSSRPLFGTGKDLFPSDAVYLPTYEDIIRCYQSIRLQIKGDKSQEPFSRTVAAAVAKKIIDIWKRASIPVVSLKRVTAMVLSYNCKYKNVIKPAKSRNTPFLQSKLKKFKADAAKLFDICACKCQDLYSCNCEKKLKVPEREKEFLIDQRTVRKMAIGNLDIVTTHQLQKRVRRKMEISDCPNKNKMSMPSTSGFQNKESHNILKDNELEIESEMDTKNADQDFKWSYPLLRKHKQTETPSRSSDQMRISMPHAALAADLTGASSRAVAKITTAVLADFNLVSPEQQTYIVDKNKVRREIEKKRKKVRENDLRLFEEKPIKSLYFDGRKDETIQQIHGHRKLTSEAHVALIEEPDSKYMGHISLTAGESAKGIAEGIIEFTRKNNISLQNLSVIGCDGTNVNTGWKGGVIRLLETNIGRPLQWNVCLLHTNELPLRHLIQEIDGCTRGPYSYSGPIGLLLKDCEKHPVVKFDKMDSTLQHLDPQDIRKLSTDQKYLYRICQAIKDGTSSPMLTDSNPGKLSHARWLTTANRLLRLYISTPSPSENLIILVKYVMLVYAPMWFEIKMKSHRQYRSQHFWKMISLSKQLPDKAKKIIFKVLSNNAYYAHPENLLVAMLHDSRKHIRELAVRRILGARQIKMKNLNGLRVFKPPQVNFEADDYIDLIDWSNCVVTEPPLTMHLKDKDLKEMCKKEENQLMTFEKLPCHTQSVERCVKLVSEAAMKVCGEIARDGYIRSKLQARKELPTFDNKGQYYSST